MKSHFSSLGDPTTLTSTQAMFIKKNQGMLEIWGLVRWYQWRRTMLQVEFSSEQGKPLKFIARGEMRNGEANN